MVRWVVVLSLVAGCDLVIGLDRNMSPTDADAARPCDRGGDFEGGEPVALTGSWGVEAARFNAEQNFAYLALYPWPGDKSKTELYTSPFNNVTKTFTGFAKINGISFGSYDSYPTVTPDQRHIVFASTRTSSLAIWIAAAKNGSFDMPTITMLPVPTGHSLANEPYMLADGRTLYFAAGSVSAWRLYKAVGDPPAFGVAAAVPMTMTTTGGYDLAPVISDDELELFFSSNRADTSSGARGLDIYSATRGATSEPFDNVRRLASLSTSGIDWPAWISPTGCELYYINKPLEASGEGRATLFIARRPPP